MTNESLVKLFIDKQPVTNPCVLNIILNATIPGVNVGAALGITVCLKEGKTDGPDGINDGDTVGPEGPYDGTAVGMR